MATQAPDEATLRLASDPSFDAFRRDDNPSSWFNIAWVIVFFPLLLLRIAFGLCAATMCYVAHVTFGVPLEKDRVLAAALPAWRATLLDNVTTLTARLALLTFGFWNIRVQAMPGYDPRTARRCAIVGNHVSMIDILIMMWLFLPSFVAKTSVLRVPVVGRVACGLQCIFVDRFGSKDSRDSVRQQVVQRQKALAAGKDVPQIVLYPEGTTTNGKYLLPFKTGVFEAGEPITLVFMRYPYRSFSPAYETLRTVGFMALLMTQLYNRCEVELWPLYVPNAAERADPTLYATNVRNMISQRGGLKLTDSTFFDKLVYHAIVRHKPLPTRKKLS